MGKKILAALLVLGLFASIINNARMQKENTELKQQFLVKTVIDGDSFILENGLKVRLLGADAPEIGLCGSSEAKNYLEKLILGRFVVIKESFADQYNRLIGYVYLGNTFVNEKILEDGWARNLSGSGSKLAVLQKAHEKAFEAKIGIFSSLCRKEEPEKPKCLIKGNISTQTYKKIYHLPGCFEYNQVVVEKDMGEDWFCSEKEAQKAGFVKSSNCPK